MIIVSQIKDAIINFDNVTIISYEHSPSYRNPYVICARYYDSDYVRIGFYKTEERAKEVLQEIIKIMSKPKVLLKANRPLKSEDLDDARKQLEDKKIAFVVASSDFDAIQLNNENTIVYEMPEE